MGIIIRQSLKASFVTYAGVALGVINQLFVATHFLSPSEVGITASLLTYAILFSSIFSLGAASISERYFSYFSDENQSFQGFLRFLLTYTGICLGIFTLIYILSGSLFTQLYQTKSTELLAFYFHIIPFTGLVMVQNILESYCRNIRRIAVPAFLREIFLRFLNIIIILLYGFGYISFSVFVDLFIGSYLAVVLGLLIYLKMTDKLNLPPVNRELLTNKLLKEMLTFGMVATLGALGTNLCSYLDQLMIGVKSGQDDTGIFRIAMLIAALIEIPRKSLAQISVPFITKAIQQKNWEEVESRNQNLSKHQLMAAGILALFVLCNLDDIFGLLPKGQIYIQGKNVVILLILAKMLDMLGGMTSEIMGYSKYYKVSTAFVIALGILTIITNLIFIPILGITGAALATLITIVCYTLARAFFVNYALKIKPFHTSGFVVLVLCAGIYLVIMFIPSLGESFFLRVLTISVKCLLISVLYIGFVWKTKLSTELNDLVLNFLRRKK